MANEPPFTPEIERMAREMVDLANEILAMSDEELLGEDEDDDTE